MKQCWPTLSDGERQFASPWFREDRRGLSPWQRVKRRVSLWGGSYEHPDGTLKLDTDEKAGVAPGDSDEVETAKIKDYLQRQGIKELKWRWFFYGLICAVVLAKLFEWKSLAGKQ